MKLLLSLSLVLASVSASAAPTSWAMINKNLDVVAKEVQKDYPYLTHLGMEFDAGSSDLAGDRVKFALTAGTDQAKWGDHQADLSVGIGLDASTLVGGQRQIKGLLDLDLKTQVIGGVKHVIARVLDSCADAKPNPSNYGEIVTSKWCEFTQKVAAVNDISGLLTVVTDSYADFMAFAPAYILDQEELLKTETDPDKVWEIKSNIRSAQVGLEQMEKLKIGGSAKKIVLSLDEDLNFGMEIKMSIRAVLTEGRVEAEVMAETLFDDSDYQYFKSEIIDFLNRIEKNESQVMAQAADLVKGYAQFIGEYLTK